MNWEAAISQFNRAIVAVVITFGIPPSATAQQCNPVRGGRVAAIVGSFTALQTAVIALRHDDWWTTPRTSFHVVWSDVSPSKGQDRFLHAAIAYHASRLATEAWDWACLSPTMAAWLGAATGVALALPKEIGDGLHENKGFSAPDMLWATAGALLPALHRTVRVSQTLTLKLFYWPSRELRDNGDNLPQLENDYAGQRYFLAFAPGLLPGGSGGWPRWLGVAFGHSVPQWISAPPTHEWYVTLDLTYGKLPIRAAWWSDVASMLDQIHFPLPGIRVTSGKVSLGFY